MGKEHEDQHIHLNVYMNPVAVFGKEKKNPQYFKASMYSGLDYTTEKNGSPLQYPCLESPMDGEG